MSKSTKWFLIILGMLALIAIAFTMMVVYLLQDSEDRIEAFLQALRSGKPAPAEIVHLRRTRIPLEECGGFSILQSGDAPRDGEGD